MLDNRDTRSQTEGKEPVKRSHGAGEAFIMRKPHVVKALRTKKLAAWGK